MQGGTRPGPSLTVRAVGGLATSDKGLEYNRVQQAPRKAMDRSWIDRSLRSLPRSFNSLTRVTLLGILEKDI